MTEPILKVEDLGKLVGGMLAGGGVTSIAEAVTQLLLLINELSKDDPLKEAKARRKVALAFIPMIREVRNAKTGADVSDIALAVIQLMDTE